MTNRWPGCRSRRSLPARQGRSLPALRRTVPWGTLPNPRRRRRRREDRRRARRDDVRRPPDGRGGVAGRIWLTPSPGAPTAVKAIGGSSPARLRLLAQPLYQPSVPRPMNPLLAWPCVGHPRAAARRPPARSSACPGRARRGRSRPGSHGRTPTSSTRRAAVPTKRAAHRQSVAHLGGDLSSPDPYIWCEPMP